MPSVFLSPSTQDWNPYLTVGNEEYWMNLIADEMEPHLRASGIDYSRNDRDQPLSAAIAASNAGRYDLHLAIHSNAGPESMPGQLRGADFYYYENSGTGSRAAGVLAEHYKSIYPLPELVTARGNTTFAELRLTNAPSVLAEVAYHDNRQDEAFIMGNIPGIAHNLVEGLALYFGIPFVRAVEPRAGTVVTESSPLLIRDRPSRSGRVVGRAPKGAALTVTGIAEGWYAVRYNETEGYSSADYIALS